MAVIRTLCGGCSVGCGIRAVTRDDGPVDIEGDRTHPANAGLLCLKGELLAQGRSDELRLAQPLVDGRATSWDRAIAKAARRIGETIARYGPQSVAMHLSGDLVTEDYYVANKLMKGFVGSAHVAVEGGDDGVAAVLAQAFGADVVPPAREDIDQADLILLVDAGTASHHPVLHRRVARARDEHGARMVAIATEGSGRYLEHDLRVGCRPGSEPRLFAGLLHAVQAAGGIDRDFVEAHVAAPEGYWERLAPGNDIWSVARDCGVEPLAVRRLVEMVVGSRRMMTLFRPPEDAQEARALTAAIVNLHLATGQIGRPGAGPMPLARGTNGMGAREVGCQADVLTAHAGFADEAARSRLARFWAARRLATGPGLSGEALQEAMRDGRIRLVWKIGEGALPDNFLEEAIGRVPQVIRSTPIAPQDGARGIWLPAAQIEEKDGGMTAADRLISRQRRLFAPPGMARPDWWIVARVANALGWGDAFAYDRAADVYREHARLTAYGNDGTQPLDLRQWAPLSNPGYDEMTPWRWGGTPFADGRFAWGDGRARLVEG
jgi:assimilatory nitrate reductase catalytic subunit